MKQIFGIVQNKQFISDSMFIKVNVEDGLYSIDIESSEYLNSIIPANIIDFDRYVKNAKRMKYIYGFSFQNTFVPQNIMKWKSFPIKLTNSHANDWEVVKVLFIPHRNIFYYMESVMNDLSNKLFELSSFFDKKESIKGVKELTPEMKIIYSLHMFEEERKKIEAEKLAELEFRKTIQGRLKYVIEQSGGKFEKYKKISDGYEVTWSVDGDRIISTINPNFSIKHLGFCCSNFDETQSMSSAVHLLKEYKEEGSYIYKTRIN